MTHRYVVITDYVANFKELHTQDLCEHITLLLVWLPDSGRVFDKRDITSKVDQIFRVI